MTSAFHVLFMKGSCLFIYETMLTIGESRAISHSDETEQQTQQVAGNHRFLTKTHRERRRRQQEAVGKAQRTSLSRVKAMSSTQQPQTYTGAATK